MAENVTKEAPAAAAAAAAAAAPARAAGGGKGPLIGIILGVVVMLGLGVGVGMFASSLLKKPDDKAAANGAADGQGAKDAAPGAHGDGIDLHKVVELSLGDLVTNITNSDGRRFVKVSCMVWVAAEDVAAIGDGDGGKHGGVQVRKLVQMALEEQLKRYDLADFTSRGAISTVSSDFLVVIENVLRQHLTDRPKDHRFVRKVILNNLLVQ